MRGLNGFTLAALIGSATTPALAAAAFEPGRWQHQTKLISAEVPGIPEALVKIAAGNSSRTTCEAASELKEHPEELMTADPKATCKLRELSMEGGKVVFDTFCTNKRFPDGLRVLSRGSYTATSYDIRTTSTGTRKGKPVKILTTSTGKRATGTCGGG